MPGAIDAAAKTDFASLSVIAKCGFPIFHCNRSRCCRPSAWRRSPLPANPGDVAPAWPALQDAAGKPDAFADAPDTKLTVLVVTAAECPIASAYEDRLTKLAREFAPRGVRFVAVELSAPPAPDADQKKSPPYPLLYDPAQRLGRDYGAVVTPTAFVLRPDRRIAYLGAIDDDWNDADEVQHRYLRDALEAALGGRPPKVQETKPVGCPIAYR